MTQEIIKLTKEDIGRKVVCVRRDAHKHWQLKVGKEYKVVEETSIYYGEASVDCGDGNRFPVDGNVNWGHGFAFVEEEKTPLEKLGLKEGDKVRVLVGGFNSRAGDILVVSADDGTDCPYFKHEDEGKNSIFPLGFAHFVELHGEQQIEKVVVRPYEAVNPRFKVGDKLVIKNNGCRYSTYNSMATIMGFKLDFNTEVENGYIVTVFDVRQHENGHTNVYGVSRADGVKVLMGEGGLGLYNPQDDIEALRVELERVTKERNGLKAKLHSVRMALA